MSSPPCRCCGQTREDVKNRNPRFRCAPKFLCAACWTDPARELSQCRHGGDGIAHDTHTSTDKGRGH